MWNILLNLVLKKALGLVYEQYIKPWLNKLKEDKKFQRAIEIAGPLIEMAERGELADLLVGKNKFEAVRDNVKHQLDKEGLDLKEYLINSAIEVAITALSEEGVINKPK